MRRAARVDANHLDICHVLRQSGQSVFSTAALGNGFTDAVTAFRGINYLVEIKDGNKKWNLTPDQVKFHVEWQGPIIILDSIQSAINWMEELRK